MTDDTLPDDLMHEKDVMDQYGHLFAERELAEARKSKTIEWHDLRKGPHYTKRQLSEYLRSKVKTTCETNPPLDARKPVPTGAPERLPDSSNLETIGSGTKRAPRASSIIGMTKQLEERAAAQLASES